MKTLWYKNLGLIALAFAIALSPRFSVGQIGGGNEGIFRVIEIRIEDVLLGGLLLIWCIEFLASKRTIARKPALFFPIAAWLGFGLLTTLVNILLGNIEITRAFFFFLKEIEFFLLYFYVFSHVRDIDSAKFLLKIWLFLASLNVFWIIFQLASGLRLSYYYGPTLFAEPQNPFASGVFFATLFLFFFNILLYYYANLPAGFFKKSFITLLILLIPIGIFASGSQTAFFSSVVGLGVSLISYLIKTRARTSLVLLFSLSILFATIFLFINVHSYSLGRQLSLDKTYGELNLSKQGSRINVWKFYLAKPFERPLGVFIGLGKSIFGETHNQYIRNFVETGIIGSILFLCLVASIIKKGIQEFSRNQDHFIVGISGAVIAITFAMLIASLPAESFIYGAKVSEVYWFFTGLAFAVIYEKRKLLKNAL